ncbi:MAG: hypothetical protein SGJ20_06615 [Planctomycetota bacterium]|nr:hypothetical protein [Planctomycetota bacterium]
MAITASDLNFMPRRRLFRQVAGFGLLAGVGGIVAFPGCGDTCLSFRAITHRLSRSPDKDAKLPWMKRCHRDFNTW